jgi:hypothetical protein
MKREILFHGKRKGGGEWVEGSLFDGFFCWILQKKAPHEDEKKGLTPFRPIEVDPNSVGQYLNRKDVDDQKLYEDDIIEFTVFDYNDNDTQHKGIISWNDELCEFYIRSTNEDGYYDGDYYNFVWVYEQDCELKKIGNLTDNPELLKEYKK